MMFNLDHTDTVTVEVYHEYNKMNSLFEYEYGYGYGAELFWSNLDQEFPRCADCACSNCTNYEK